LVCTYYVTSRTGQLSQAIPSWVGAMSTSTIRRVTYACTLCNTLPAYPWSRSVSWRLTGGYRNGDSCPAPTLGPCKSEKYCAFCICSVCSAFVANKRTHIYVDRTVIALDQRYESDTTNPLIFNVVNVNFCSLLFIQCVTTNHRGPQAVDVNALPTAAITPVHWLSLQIFTSYQRRIIGSKQTAFPSDTAV